MSNSYVMDACALLALLNNEDGADREAMSENVEVYMNKINIFEIYYGVYRAEGELKAEEVYRRILRTPIKVIETFDHKVFRVAGKLKSKYRMSLADSIALGEAVVRNAAVLSSDHHEFDVIEKQESIKFNWIR